MLERNLLGRAELVNRVSANGIVEGNAVGVSLAVEAEAYVNGKGSCPILFVKLSRNVGYSLCDAYAAHLVGVRKVRGVDGIRNRTLLIGRNCRQGVLSLVVVNGDLDLLIGGLVDSLLLSVGKILMYGKGEFLAAAVLEFGGIDIEDTLSFLALVSLVNSEGKLLEVSGACILGGIGDRLGVNKSTSAQELELIAVAEGRGALILEGLCEDRLVNRNLVFDGVGVLADIFDSRAVGAVLLDLEALGFDFLPVEVRAVRDILADGYGGADGYVRDGDGLAVLDRELALVGCAALAALGVGKVVETACGRAAEVERNGDRELFVLTLVAGGETILEEVNGLLADLYVSDLGSVLEVSLQLSELVGIARGCACVANS